MSSSFDQVMSMRRFDAITIVFTASVTGKDYVAVIQAMLRDALAGLEGVPEAEQWSVELFDEESADTFDLIPPDDQAITDKLAFDIRNALADNDEVAYTEALFDVVSTIMPDEIAEEDDEAAAQFDDVASFSIFGSANWWDKLTVAEQDVDWNHKIVGTTNAWTAGKGEGIIIGHPDTGYIPHFELADENIDDNNGYDFVDDDLSAVNAFMRGGNHGLGTSSVIISKTEATDQPRTIFGVAPEATIMPFRIAPNWAPVFLTPVGPRRVRNAVHRARQKGCHIISMSLGGVPSRTLHEEIQKAVKENIIVIAAAGNYVRFVVWPALYEEVIAVAACGADRTPWTHSSRGRAVDVTAPGHNVWRATIDKEDKPTVRPGSGTSYATPHVSAAAALWLAKHGRDSLLETYKGIPLAKVFREVLRQASDPFPGVDGDRFGAGILNIPRLLAADLPDLDDFTDEGLAFDVAATGEHQTVDAFCAVFDEVPRATTRARLAELLGVDETQLNTILKEINGDELLMRVITSPDLRQFFAVSVEDDEEEEAFDAGITGARQSPARSYFLGLDLSDDFRQHITS